MTEKAEDKGLLETTNAQEQPAMQAPAIAEQKPAKTRVFKGVHYPESVTRNFEASDPAMPGRVIKTRKKFDLITFLVIDRVSGHDDREANKEPYITLSGQYAPYSLLRITASSQNSDLVKDLVRPLLNASDPRNSKDGQTIYLREPIIVNAIGQMMRAYGLNLHELYQVNEQGEVGKVIIAASEQAVQKESKESLLL